MISGDQGGDCLVALARERGRQLRSRTGQQQHRSRSLPKSRGGRNNKYSANISKTTQDMTKHDARRVLTRCEVIPVKGETSGKISPVFRVFGQMNQRGKVASLIC